MRVAGCTRLIQSEQLADKDRALAHYYRGSNYHDLGRYTEAIRDFTEAIRIDPNDSRSIGKRGFCLLYTSPSPRDS